ncbi:polymorphic toxin type 44 domain-containing protein [Phenylobacterium sp.]|uniref:polymorphic toxin type 44 domain-containing protein n=1 Tax=Phenylobacterium sp. TaxID=1871053 RepID=UPI0035B42A4C
MEAGWRGVPYALPDQSAPADRSGGASGRLPSRSDTRQPNDDAAGGLYASEYGHDGHRPKTLDLRNTDPKASPVIDLSRSKPGDVIVTDRATIRMDKDNVPQVTLHEGFGNGRSAAAVGPILAPNGPAVADVDSNMAEARSHDPFWFRQMVPNRGPWDYKQRGNNGEYEAFGNFHYGATGKVVGPVGIPSGNLFQEAGRAQTRDHTSNSEFGSPGIRFLPFTGTKSLGDDPVDQYWIEQGIRYAGSH